MDEAERIAREAHAKCLAAPWASYKGTPTGDALATAARLGIEHGERASKAKIADMRRVLNEIATSACGRHTPDSDAAAQCLARNFPAPKPRFYAINCWVYERDLAYQQPKASFTGPNAERYASEHADRLNAEVKP